jgi:hypothetical protein
MMPIDLLYLGIVVFVLVLIGFSLTMMEFRNMK